MRTLGDIIDRLCIVKLKNYYADTDEKKASTKAQLAIMAEELDKYMSGVLSGEIETVQFAQNKVYTKFETVVGDPVETMSFGELMSKLMEANHLMWLHQDQLYAIDTLPDEKIRPLIQTSAALNVERNQFMDAINDWLAKALKGRN